MTEWYYVDNLRQRQGPVPQDALVKLFQANKKMFATAYKAAGVDERKLRKSVESRAAIYPKRTLPAVNEIRWKILNALAGAPKEQEAVAQ